MPQLHIKDLLSVGVVDVGDNPPAEILLFKSRQAKHSLPGSIDAQLDLVRRAFRDANPGDNGPWIDAVFDSFVIVSDGDDTLQIPYTVADENVSFGLARQVSLETEIAAKRKFSTEERKRLAKQGLALPDGSFPIVSIGDLRNAVKAVGRAASTPRAKRHIIRRARALGRIDLLPDAWKVSKMQPDSLRGAIPKGVEVFEDLDLSGLDDETQAVLTKAFADVTEAHDEAVAKVAELEKTGAKDELHAQVKSLTDELAATNTKLAAEVEARQDREAADRAAEIQDLIGSAEDAVELEKQLTNLGDIGTKVHDSLKAVAQRADLSKILTKIGDEGDTPTDPMEQRDVFVKAYLADHPDKSEAEARVLFWKTHPEAREAQRQ